MNLTEEQRRKINQFIAEKRGWKSPDHPDTKAQTEGYCMPEKWWMDPTGELQFRHNIPDYTRSFDACHDGEKALKAYQCEAYHDNLCGVLPYDWTAPGWVFHATAEQRAIALFQTLGGQL